MKRLLNVLPGLIAGIVGALLLAGCSNQISPAPDASEQGRVTIRIGNGEQARTLFPQTPVFSRYELEFTPESDQAVRENEVVAYPSGHTVTLAVGSWTITAIAYVQIGGVEGIPGGEYEAARGSETIYVNTEGNNSVDIDIRGQAGDGQGIFTYSLSYPADVDAAALIILDPLGTTLVEERDLLTVGPSGSLVLNAGYYILGLVLEKDGGTAVKVEAIHIYKNMTTMAEGADYEFTGDDFPFVVDVDTDPDVIGGTMAHYATDGVFFSMVAVPGRIAFPTGTDDSGTAAVRVPYQIGETEVTWKLWNTVRTWALSHGYSIDAGQAGSNQSSHSDQQPATNISWYSMAVWCNALTEYWNEKTGASLATVYNDSYAAPIRNAYDIGTLDTVTPLPSARGFRLPTSSEWELAARWQGETNRGNSVERDGYYYTGGNSASGASRPFSDSSATGAVAVYGQNYNTGWTAEVNGRQANALGLYDMSGNVWERCFDRDSNSTSIMRIMRGAGFSDVADRMQIGNSIYSYAPSCLQDDVGFRLARTGYKAGEIVPQVGAPPEDEDFIIDEPYDPSWPVLQNNVWHDDSDPVKYCQFYAQAGTSYVISWNDSYEGDGSKTADIGVSAYWKATDAGIFSLTDSGWDSPITFTADRSGIVVLKAESYMGGNTTGTFAIKYATDSLSLGISDSITFSAPAGHAAYQWIIDGASYPVATDTITLTAASLGLGPHPYPGHLQTGGGATGSLFKRPQLYG
jgi:formylglycine-generating enzyme required for sulfatase activity